MTSPYTNYQVEQNSYNSWSKAQLIEDILKIANVAFDKKHLTDYKIAWWFNTRHDNKGFRLTDAGLAALRRVKFTAYNVELKPDTKFTNQLILRLDTFIECPYYLEKNKIIVFDDKMAVQLMLFSGDIKQYSDVKQMHIDET